MDGWLMNEQKSQRIFIKCRGVNQSQIKDVRRTKLIEVHNKQLWRINLFSEVLDVECSRIDKNIIIMRRDYEDDGFCRPSTSCTTSKDSIIFGLA